MKIMNTTTSSDAKMEIMNTARSSNTKTKITNTTRSNDEKRQGRKERSISGIDDREAREGSPTTRVVENPRSSMSLRLGFLKCYNCKSMQKEGTTNSVFFQFQVRFWL
jgi:hypothetical protein